MAPSWASTEGSCLICVAGGFSSIDAADHYWQQKGKQVSGSSIFKIDWWNGFLRGTCFAESTSSSFEQTELNTEEKRNHRYGACQAVTHHTPTPNTGTANLGHNKWRFFIFLFFIFVFYKNIFSFSKFTGIYPAAPLPDDRDVVAPLRGGRGFCAKFFTDKPMPPGSGATRCRPPDSWVAGYIIVNFENENIFL